MDNSEALPYSAKFIIAGLAGMGATCFVQPLHLVKNRMQMEKNKNTVQPNTVQFIRTTVKDEGITGLYSGFSAGLLRQATYTATRIGIYTFLTNQYIEMYDEPPSFVEKAGLGMIAGMCGAFVGTPTEIALARMTIDGKLPNSDKWNYKDPLHAFFHIQEQEGTKKLWRGATPTIYRSVVVNCVQLSTFTQAKEALHQSGFINNDNIISLLSSIFSGLMTVITSLPIDTAKTKIHTVNHNKAYPVYNNIIDVWKKTVNIYGILGLWKGFTPYFVKVGSHTVLTFLFLEKFEDFYRQLNQKQNFELVTEDGYHYN